MGVEVKLSMLPDEFDLLRKCITVAFEVARDGDYVCAAKDLNPRRVKMLEEYLDSGKRPRHGVSV